MKTSDALKTFRNYQKSNLKPSTVIGYRYLLVNFEELFGDKTLESIDSEDIFQLFRKKA